MAGKVRKIGFGFLRNLASAAGRFAAESRVGRWVARNRAMRFAGSAAVRASSLFAEQIWQPVRPLVRRARRYLGRHEPWVWVATWMVCVLLGWVILLEPIFLRILAGLVAVCAFTIIAFRSPAAGVLIWICLAPLLNAVVRVRLLAAMPVFTVDRLCIVILLLVFLASAKREWKAEPNRVLHLGMLFFLCAMLFSALKNEEPVRAAEQVVNVHGVPMLAYVFGRRWITSRRALAVTLAAIIGVGFYFSAVGIPEHFLGRTFFGGTQWIEEELETVRVQGPAETPQEFGLVVAAAVVFAMVVLANGRSKAGRFLCLLAIVVGLVAVGFTLRRSVYAGSLIGVIAMLIGTRRVRIAAAIMLLIGAILLVALWQPLVGSKLYSERLADLGPLYSRAVIQATAWNMIKHKPVFGVGFENFGIAAREYAMPYKDVPVFLVSGLRSPHSSYLRILVEGGAVAFLPFVVILVSIIAASVRMYKRLREPGLLGRDGIVAFLALTSAVVLQATSTDASFHSIYLVSIWYFLFGALSGTHLQREGTQETGAD